MNDYIKQLEEQNETLKQLLSVSERREIYWKNKSSKYFIFRTTYKESTSFNDGIEFEEYERGYVALTSIKCIREYVNNCPCVEIDISRCDGDDLIWSLSFSCSSVDHMWEMSGVIYYDGGMNPHPMDLSNRKKTWNSFNDMIEDIQKYAAKKQYNYERLY